MGGERRRSVIKFRWKTIAIFALTLVVAMMTPGTYSYFRSSTTNPSTRIRAADVHDFITIEPGKAKASATPVLSEPLTKKNLPDDSKEQGKESNGNPGETSVKKDTPENISADSKEQGKESNGNPGETSVKKDTPENISADSKEQGKESNGNSGETATKENTSENITAGSKEQSNESNGKTEENPAKEDNAGNLPATDNEQSKGNQGENSLSNNVTKPAEPVVSINQNNELSLDYGVLAQGQSRNFENVLWINNISGEPLTVLWHMEGKIASLLAQDCGSFILLPKGSTLSPQSVLSSTPSKSPPEIKSVEQNQLYRIRKSWADEKSQIGAFKNLGLAQALAQKTSGYKVFDNDGNLVSNKDNPKAVRSSSGNDPNPPEADRVEEAPYSLDTKFRVGGKSGVYEGYLVIEVNGSFLSLEIPTKVIVK